MVGCTDEHSLAYISLRAPVYSFPPLTNTMTTPNSESSQEGPDAPWTKEHDTVMKAYRHEGPLGFQSNDEDEQYRSTPVSSITRPLTKADVEYLRSLRFPSPQRSGSKNSSQSSWSLSEVVCELQRAQRSELRPWSHAFFPKGWLQRGNQSYFGWVEGICLMIRTGVMHVPTADSQLHHLDDLICRADCS